MIVGSIFGVVLIALLIGGGVYYKADQDDRAAQRATAAAADREAAAQAPSSSRDDGELSVPECDEYLRRVDVCKGPAAAALRGSADAIRANLKNPGGDATTGAALKSALAKTCKSSMAALAACR